MWSQEQIINQCFWAAFINVNQIDLMVEFVKAGVTDTELLRDKTVNTQATFLHAMSSLGGELVSYPC